MLKFFSEAHLQTLARHFFPHLTPECGRQAVIAVLEVPAKVK